jgi:hypothetical protein
MPFLRLVFSGLFETLIAFHLMFYVELKFSGSVCNIFVKGCIKLRDFRTLELVLKTNELNR